MLLLEVTNATTWDWIVVLGFFLLILALIPVVLSFMLAAIVKAYRIVFNKRKFSNSNAFLGPSTSSFGTDEEIPLPGDQMREIILAIESKHKRDGITINPPAPQELIHQFERTIGFALPPDFREFYSICNGFVCTEDIFRIIPLHEMARDQDYGDNWFDFAEYMIYCDAWSLRKRTDGSYEIFNKGEVEIVLGSSLQQFLKRFLQGNVFEKGGLYDWHEEQKSR